MSHEEGDDKPCSLTVACLDSSAAIALREGHPKHAREITKAARWIEASLSSVATNDASTQQMREEITASIDGSLAGTPQQKHYAEVRLHRTEWLVVKAALAARSATAENTAHQQFADCVRNLVNGSAFDLTDSPRSFIATVQRLVTEMDDALKPESYVQPSSKENK